MEQLPDEKLCTEFSPISTQEWERKIIQDLKGADYEKKLIWHTQEGFNVKPYYRAEDLKEIEYLNVSPFDFPFVRGGKNKESNDWEIRQDIEVRNIVEANKKALQILELGANSLGFKVSLKAIDTQNKLSALLHDIHFDCVTLNFLGDQGSPVLFEYLKEEANLRGYKTASLTGSFNYDPIGHLNITGNFYISEEDDFRILKKFIFKDSISLPGYKLITIDGSKFSNAGSSIVQELAFSLSAGNEYLTRLTDSGHIIDDISSRIFFTFSIGSSFFMEIAKLRAARLLWAKIVESYSPKNLDNTKMHIHSVTTNWNKTIYDPYVNILRATTESMSAALGGADSLQVIPFDTFFAGESEFSSRIARYTQIILKEEAYFSKVIDPAAGSYYIENLTDNIVDHAWKLFLEIEEKGGYIQAFKNGFIQELINKTTSQRLNLIATRKEILLGTNQYPSFHEQAKDKVNFQIFERSEKRTGIKIAEPIRIFRGAEDFEKLRLQTETSSRAKPKIFMLTIGNPAMRKARSTFSCNFFACAGYEVIDNDGFNTVEEGVKAAFEIRADVIVLCSGDDEYAVYAPEIHKLINEKIILIIAGEPACKPELEAKGIRNYISLRSNLLETLKYYHHLLGLD